MSNLSVNAIRFLGIDAINKANSGHPGVVMGAAPMAYSLFTKHFVSIQLNQTGLTVNRFYSFSRSWFNAPYALLHLSGFEDVSHG